MDVTEVKHYRVYKIRWIQLIVYILTTFANATSAMTFAPIEPQTSKFFNITTAEHLFFKNSTALFAARWFPPSQCDIATSICSMANPLGLAIGSHLPSLIITDNRSLKYFFILLIKHHQSINLKQDFINLIKNRHYLILLFCFTLGLALFNTIKTLIEQLIKPSIYTNEDAGIFGAIIIIAGLLNAFLAGFIMDKTDAYRLILKFLLIGACASAIFFILIIRPNQFNRLSLSI
ncbi:unnamed protein product [Rotaria sp. Silwood1]|nr:unnamed protein product [Rotaria sp. Silwood1]